MLRDMIRFLEIERFFDDIYGLAHQKGDSKILRAKELAQDFDIDPQTALFIGDTDHDGEVAQALGMSVALISTGHQSEKRLRKTGQEVYESHQDLSKAIFSPA